MPAGYTNVSSGFEVGGDSYIDRRLLLTKEQMRGAYDEWFMPPRYIAYCLDDQQWYEYNEENEESPETGFYRPIPSGIVKDVRIEGVSILDSEGIADFEFPVEDVLVDGVSVVENKKAKIDLSNLQEKITGGEGIEVNSEGKVSIDNAVVPTKDELEDLVEDLGFITAQALNNVLDNYYTDSEVYNKTEVNNLISQIAGGIELEIVAVLPLTGESNKIYLVRREVGSNVYDQYVWFNYAWVQVGSTEVDLSQYYTKLEVDNLLTQKQGLLVPGQGISITGNVISADIQDLPEATSSRLGVIKYDNDTIRKNAEGQLYATAGGGVEYTAGPGIDINNANRISAKVDDETIHTNRYGELYMDAVAIDAGDGINIRDGVISINPPEVADAIDLDLYQKKLVAGNNITIDPINNIISATGGGSGSGANWGEIGGTLSNQPDLWAALQGKANTSQIPTAVSQLTNDVPYAIQASVDNLGLTKQDKLTAGANITISADNVISATGGSGPTQVNWTDIVGNPLDNTNLASEIAAAKQQPTVSNANIMVYKNNTGSGNLIGGFSLNQASSSNLIIPIPDPVTPGNGTLTLTSNGNQLGTFNANQSSNTSIDIPVPSVPSVGNGALTIKQGTSTLGTFYANQSTGTTITIPANQTVNDGVLTIQRNGENKGTFTANASGNTTVNITVPTFSLSGTVLTITNN